MPARCEKDKAWIQSPAPFVSQSRTAFLGSPTSTHTARSTELRIAATTFLYRQARRQYATGGTLSAPREFVMARQQSTCAARHVMSQGAEEPSSGFLRPLGGAGRACLREAEHFGAVVQPKALRTLAELPPLQHCCARDYARRSCPPPASSRAVLHPHATLAALYTPAWRCAPAHTFQGRSVR